MWLPGVLYYPSRYSDLKELSLRARDLLTVPEDLCGQ